MAESTTQEGIRLERCKILLYSRTLVADDNGEEGGVVGMERLLHEY